jgi:hypothetical protein
MQAANAFQSLWALCLLTVVVVVALPLPPESVATPEFDPPPPHAVDPSAATTAIPASANGAVLICVLLARNRTVLLRPSKS